MQREKRNRNNETDKIACKIIDKKSGRKKWKIQKLLNYTGSVQRQR